eukprot:5691923-Prymnesium_polylepis.1
MLSQSHVTASESDRDSAVVTCELCSLDVAPCTPSTHQPRQAHSERLWHTCTHAPDAARTCSCMPRSRPNHMHPGTSS